MNFDVRILGCNSAIPANGRHPTSQVVNHNDQLFLIDCGEGTQMQMNLFRIRRSRINHIFISHLHGDHIFGLIGLLTSYHLMKREQTLHVYAPKGLEEIIRLQLDYSQTALVYELVFHQTDANSFQVIYETRWLEVLTIPLQHRIPCTGFLFREKKRERKLIPSRLKKYEVPIELIKEIKAGKDFQHPTLGVIANSELTSNPPHARSYAFCSDTIFDESLIEKIKDVDLLYHESTFADDSAERAASTFHSTSRQAGIIARKANAKQLVIGHFSAKYDWLDLLLQQAQEEFPNTKAAVEGETYAVAESIT